jgi:hypothetical protein
MTLAFAGIVARTVAHAVPGPARTVRHPATACQGPRTGQDRPAPQEQVRGHTGSGQVALVSRVAGQRQGGEAHR